MTLAEFLLARIAEDEAYAWQIVNAEWADYSAEWWTPSSGIVEVGDDVIATGDTALGSHLARWDPARVLAECEAKRQIVGRATPLADDQVRRQTRDLAVTTLRLLALPYAEHPDYRKEWTP